MREESDFTGSIENVSSISILIRAFNSEKTLGRLLSALKRQKGDEVLVIDSGSTDRTLDVAADHGARIFHAPPPFNYSKSLNIGFREAINSWVLVISSHSRPQVPDLLDIFRAAIVDLPEDVAVAYGPNTLTGMVPYKGAKIKYYTRENYRTADIPCGNGNALYRKAAWEDVPFDENIRTAEDIQWMNEIFNRKQKIAFVFEARTINQSRYSLKYMFLKGYSDMRAAPHAPMKWWMLFLALGSHTKRCLAGKAPFGNWIRYGAHILGQFFGSHQPRDNVPL